jgi:hypothetical protein
VLLKTSQMRNRTPRTLRAASHRPAADQQRPGAATRVREPAHQDTALYSCQCGLVFEAEVSTTVACPHCGHGQPW